MRGEEGEWKSKGKWTERERGLDCYDWPITGRQGQGIADQSKPSSNTRGEHQSENSLRGESGEEEEERRESKGSGSDWREWKRKRINEEDENKNENN